MTHNDFVWARERRASRDHLCGECGRVIPEGETYEIASGLGERSMFAVKACRQCTAFRLVITVFDGGFSEAYYGGVATWVQERFWREVSGADTLLSLYVTLIRLVVGFKKQWAGPVWADVPETVAAAVRAE